MLKGQEVKKLKNLFTFLPVSLLSLLIVSSLIFHPSFLYSGGSLHYTNHWHDHQPLYWPNKTRASTAERWETAPENIDFTGSAPWAGHPANDIVGIFGLADRVAAYQGRCRDALSTITGYPEAGFTASYTGALAMNVSALGNQFRLGYSPGWNGGWKEARGWLTTGGKTRMDILLTGFAHSTIFPLLPYNTLSGTDSPGNNVLGKRLIELYKQYYPEIWGISPPMSTGFWPLESSFSERMIPYLLDIGATWTYFANSHLSRAMPNWPATPGNGMNTEPPNKADQSNPNGGQFGWRNATLDGRPTTNDLREGYRPHYVEYIDPKTGVSKKIIGVPMADYESYFDGFQTFDTLLFDAIAGAQDPARPAMVPLAHDGDNAWGGGFDSYMTNTPNKASAASAKGYTPSSIAQYLADHPVPVTDIWHVEDGPWVNADSDFGSPTFANWNWPWKKDNLPNRPNFDPTAWDDNSQFWAIATALSNRLLTAESMIGAPNMANALHPENGAANALEKAWHYMVSWMDSGHIYYGTASDFSFIPMVNGNRTADFVDTIIGAGELPASASDTVPPSIWVPQRFPYNPGSNNYGVAYNWRNFVYPAEFDVFTFAYDASGLASVKLYWRTATGTNSAPVKPDNFTYAGGAAVSSWNQIAMSTAVWSPKVFLNNVEQVPAPITPKYLPVRAWAHVSPGTNKLVDYYVEAIDNKGNVQKTDILHVWVGDGSGATGGGGTQGSLWSPQSPTADQTIKVAISTRNVTGATAGFFHWGVNNGVAPTGWKLASSQYWPSGTVQCDAVSVDSPLTAESQPSIGITSYTVTLGPFMGAQNVSEVNFVFHWGATSCTGGTWNNNGGANWQISVGAANNVKPAPPTRITATAKNQAIDLAWDASTSTVNGYNVYQWNNAGSTYTKHNTGGLITGTTYGITVSTPSGAALANGTTYTFVITAVNSSLNPESVYSVAVTTAPSAADSSAPAAPTNPTATGGVTQVSLSWTKNLETDLQDYRIYVASFSGSFSTKVATKTISQPATTGVVTGLTANVTYYFQITARDASANESAPTFEVSAMAQSVPPPTAPTGLAATPGNTQATLTWNANTEGNLAGYNLYRSTVSGGPFTKVNSSLIAITTFTDTGLTNGTPYFYRLTAVNSSASESAFSTQISVTPNTVISVVFQVDMRGIPNVTSVVIAQNTLAPVWSASGFPMTNQSGSLQGIWKTTLSLNPATAFQYKYVFNGTTWENDFGAVPNNNRSLTVSANNADGKMYASNQWNVAGDASPLTPGGVLAQGLASGILVKWSTGTDFDIEKYNLYQSTWQTNPNFGFSVSATSASYKVGSLTTGVTYYFKVEAQDLAGQKSGLSSVISAVANQDSPPAAPTGLVATAKDVAIDLVWSPNSEPDLSGYLVNWGTSNGGPYPNQSSLISGTTSIYTISGLTNGVTYYIVVRASDTAGNISANSAQVSASPVLPSNFEERTIDGNFLDWKFSDVKALDPYDDEYLFNDGFDQSRDILALYAREGKDNYYFRVDFQELGINAEASNLDVYVMLSWAGQTGGQNWLPDFTNCQTNAPWKIGLSLYNANSYNIYNSTWGTENWSFNGAAFNSTYDSVEFAIKKQVMINAGWTPGTPLQMQCFTTKDGTQTGGPGHIATGPSIADAAGITLDRTASFLNGFVSTTQSTGRAKYAFIYHGNQSINLANDIRDWIYSQRSDGTTLKDTGYRLGLDTIDKYGVKGNLHISGSLLSAFQWADPTFTSRIKTMLSAGKVGLLGGVLAEHIMPYFENDAVAGLYANSKAIRARKDMISNILNPPQMPKVFWVPERVIRGTTFKDILTHPETGEPTGYTATVLDDNYHMKDWFGMPLTQRFKLHKVNGVLVFLINGIDARLGLPAGGDTNPDGSKFWVQDSGAHIQTRKTLSDLARSSDQEQLVLVFDDWEAYAGRSFTSALANNNAAQWDQTIGWIANHQWVETVTLDDVLTRGWTAIDHGANEGLPLKTYDWLSRASQWSYDNWYFGSPLEESFSNRVPKIKGTTALPNNKSYGHINTVGTLMRDTWDQIRNAPNNQLKNYAEMVYNTLNFETAWHDEDQTDKFAAGSDTTFDAISGWATFLHGHMRESAVIAKAAQWAQNVSSGTQGSATTAEAIDVDLDGENEFVLRNNKVYAVFENDGGRLKMAFAYDANISTGGFQIIGAPAINYEFEGEEAGTKHLYAFEDMNGGTYVDDNYSAQIWVSSITLTSSDGKVKKTIALPDNSDTLTANYQETVLGALFVRFGLSPNARDLYRNGKGNLAIISSGTIVGARNTNGGQALLTLGAGVTVNSAFTDGTSDNTNSPHTKIYELSGDGNFTISLTLNNGGAADTTAPGALTNLVAATGSNDGEIALQWTAPGDDGYTGNNDSTAKYLLRYATYPVSGGDIEGWWANATVFINTWTVSAQGTTENKTMTGLQRGALYHLTIRTQDKANNLSSVQMMVSTTTRPDTIPPNAVTSLKAISGSIDGSIILSWIAPGDDGTTGTAKLYDIRYSTTASLSPASSDSNFNSATAVSQPPPPLPLASGSTQSLTLTGLVPGTSYYFSLKSKDASLWSALSNGTTAKARIDDIAPSNLTNLVATMTSSAGQISLNWTAPGNDGTSGTAAIYILKISSMANITNNAGFDGALPLSALSSSTLPSPLSFGNLQSLTVTGLVPGATYWFALRAMDQAGSTGSWTSDLTTNATNFASAGLQTVTGFTGSTVSAASLKWSWIDIQGESGYQIVTDTGGVISAPLAVNSISYTETGLQPNQKAIRQVKALFSSLNTLSLSATQYTLANPPTTTVVSSVTVSTVAITWDTNSNSSGTTFELRRASFSPITTSVSVLATLSSPASTYSDGLSLVEGVTYYYRLRAINANNIDSAFDAEASTLIPRIAPAAITGLSALTGTTAGSVNLSWIAPHEDASAGGAVTSYIVKVATFSFDDSRWNDATIAQGPPSPVAPGLTQTMTVGSLTAGTLYYFRVKSLDDGSNLSPLDSTPTQAQAFAKISQNLPKPPIYIAFLWHMHQPIYYPYENIVQTEDNFRYSFSVIGVHTGRTGPYTSWPYDAIAAGGNAGLKKLGASVSFTGSLMENIKNIAAAGRGFAGDWGWGYRNGFAWKTQAENSIPPGAASAGGGNARLDLIGFGYHHPLMGLVWDQDIRTQIRLHRLQLTNTFAVPAGSYSKGIFPPENAFREEMIPSLSAEGIQWVLVDNVHFDRTVKGYPWNSGGNLYEPNPADQMNNPLGITWKSLTNLWAPTPVSVPWGYQPHYVQYTDPNTGQATKIIAVPGARYEGNEDARGGFGAFLYETVMSQYEANNTDALHPMLVVLPHDGDNYGGGSDQYYHGNFSSFVNWLLSNPSRFVCTTIQDYLDMFPPDASDVIHVENGSWSGADNGDPEFLKWNGKPVNGYSYDRNSWSVVTAAKNRIDHAAAIQPATSDTDILNGTGNNTAKALHYFYSGEASDHWYWDGTEIWDSNPTRAANQAVPFADNVINLNPGVDSVGPTIYIPQRDPYNPGGKMWGIQQISTFTVWTFVYDVSGLSSVQLKYRVDQDGVRDALNNLYSGGTWNSLNMSAQSFASLTNPLPTYKADQYSATISTAYNNLLIDYYVEATDTKGNISKSAIQHVFVGVGTGGTGGAATLWSPSNPTQNDLITIPASQLNKSGKLHWGVNNWTQPNAVYWPSNSTTTIFDAQSVNTVLLSTEAGKYFIQLGPFNRSTIPVTAVNFVFNWNDGTWDNNGGANWTIPISISSGVQNSSPTVTITFPQNNSSVSGSSVNISASATPGSGGAITWVHFYYRASTSTTLIFISSGQVSPYVTNWNTTLLFEDTNYVLVAKADDVSGNRGTSVDVTVRVNNVNSSPNISLISPRGGEGWTGSQNILWNATDPDGDNLNITLQYATTGSAWTDIINSMQNLSTFTWDTTLLPNSTSYWVRAIAKDPGGLTALSDSGLFTIRNVPSDIKDLSASASQNGSEITLSWTAPGADDTLGAAASYDIRYSTNILLSPAVSISSFNAASSVSAFGAIPAPQVFGTAQSMTLTGLAGNTSYYFAMRARDGVPLWDALSNGATAFTAPDVSSPSAVTSLSASALSGSQIRLTWISPGDDGTIGVLSLGSQFQIKYSTTSSDGWSAANSITISTFGVAPGSLRARTVTGLNSGTSYYFWIKTQDEIGNLASLSNTATGYTPSGQLTYHNITVDGSLSDWDNNTELMDLRNGDSFYFTWSSTAVYIAYAGPDANTVSNDFFVVFDTQSDYNTTLGSGSAVMNWDGAEAHIMPFKADYALCVEGAAYKAVRNWTGSTWNDPGDGGGIAAQSLGATVNEIAILRSTLNNPTHLRVMMFHKWDTAKNVYNSYPPENPAPNTDTAVNFSYFYDIDLVNGATPKNAAHVSSASFVDNTAPSAVTNLTAFVGTNKGEINLSWTSPGDDGSSGTLTGKFRIDHSTNSNYAFSGPSTYKIELAASNNPGDTVSNKVVNLIPGGTYYFRVWSQDDNNNWSAVSNGATNYAKPDLIAPSQVSSLSASVGVNQGQILLSWLAPGDDGTTGTANSYSIKFSTIASNSPASSDANFDAAQNVNSTSPVPSPLAFGTNQTMIVTGLISGVTYYFALKAMDSANNLSLVSNGATAWAQVSVPTPDTTAPSQITNLSAQTGTNTGEILLTWTAPGNDGTTGNNAAGALYQLKYATFSVTGGAGSSTTTWWNNAQIYSQSWSVLARGANESQTIALSASTTYYFGIKTVDAAGNMSLLDTKASSTTSATSNIAQAENGTLSGNATIETGGTGQVVHLIDANAKVTVTINSGVTSQTVSVWGKGDNGVNGAFEKNGTGFFNYSSWSAGYSTNSTNAQSFSANDSVDVKLTQAGNVWIDYFIINGAFGGSSVSQQASAVSAAANDTTAPSAVTDLSATQGASAGQVQLIWTSVGNDGLTGSITNGKYRIDYSTDSTKSWSVNSFQVQLTTDTSPGSAQGYLVAGLNAGTTYFFKIWTADAKPNWSEISNGATAYAAPGSVNIVMDGIKDDAWGNSPLATSIGFNLPDNRARDLYATSDANYLYIGFQFNGDPWDDAGGAKSAHFVFLIDTGTASGTTADPWVNTTAVNWTDKPDLAVNGWINGTAATNFGGMTRYVSNGAAWDTGTAMVSGTDFFANKNNDWAEFRIPRSTLGVTNGQTIKILEIFRPAEDKPGASDSTPYDGATGACNDYGNSGSNLSQFVTYKFPGGDVTPPADVTGISAVAGSTVGSIALTWTMPGDDGWSGNISGGKFRIAYSSNPAFNFQLSNYQIERTTNATPNTTHGILLTGLSGGDTYYIRIWVADEAPNWSGISSGATTWAKPPPPPAPVFTPTIDGIKDASWGSQPNATSQNFKLPDDRARDVYVTNDANNLYVGFQFNGDPWGTAESNTLAAHYIFLMDTGTTSGTATDPWVNTTQVSWSNKPDVAVAGWHNKNTSANSMNEMKRYVSNGTSWDAGTSMVSGADFASSVSNDWAEFKVPLSVLRSTSGAQIRMVLLFRPDENKPGVSDTTPFDSAGTSDWGNGNPATVAESFTYTLRSVGDVTPPDSITNLSALRGNIEGSMQLSWSALGNDGNSGSLLSGSQFAIQYSSLTSVSWSTSAAQVLIATANINPASNIQYQISNLQAGDTYFFRVWTKDEANNWSTISNGATNWAQIDVTSPSAITTLAATPGTNSGEIKLSWLAPGDDGTNGTAQTYDVRYSTTLSLSPSLSASNFNSATAVSTAPAPLISGSTQSLTITGLVQGWTYYFAMRTKDERGNLSLLSNGATTFAQFDLIPPSAITNLSALAGTNSGEVQLSWTNPGNDGTSNALTGFYRIDYSTIAGVSWSVNSYKIQVATTNAAPLSAQSVVVTGLTTSVTYYFRVWVGDDQTNVKSPNWSSLSNGATIQSAASANITVAKSRSPENPRPGELITYTLTFGNNGNGAAQSVIIKDRIPNYVDYEAGTIKLNSVSKTDAADSDEASFDNGLITVNFGTLGSGVTGQTVEYQVRVR